MHKIRKHIVWWWQGREQPVRALLLLVTCLLSSALSGCAALTNPVADGLPVGRLPPELLAPTKEGLQTLPLSVLRQKPPAAYRLAPGDVLGVWIEGVLGERNQSPPVQLTDTGTQPPAMGLPIPVRADGTLPLPFIEPLSVSGMTIEEAEKAIRDAYTVKKQVLQPGRERIIVTLLRRRQTHVLVFREDAGGPGTGGAAASVSTRSLGITLGSGTVGSLKRGTGFAVDLPAYENDVLHALALTGGLPGLDAVNEVAIQRGSFQGELDREAALQELHALPPDCDPRTALAYRGGQTIRIPLRYRPGEAPPIRPEEVVLQTGDIVFIEAREADLFYTGGLLPPGSHVIPRDYDLDVVQAVMLVGGPLVSGGLNPINLSGTFLSSGIGFPSPSLLTVVRRTPGGGQVAIRVDLNRALRDPRERILVQPRDVLILQETPGEAFARYFTTVFRFNFIWAAIHGPHEQGTTNVVVP